MPLNHLQSLENGLEGGIQSSPEIPDWLQALAPGLTGEDALRAALAWERCGEELFRQTQRFASQALAGVPCRLVEQGSGFPARYSLDETLSVLAIEDCRASDVKRRRLEVELAQIRNLWVCADNELARRTQGLSPSAPSAEARMACLVLVDGPAAPTGLVLRSSEAREEFLDCMAVLIAAQRMRLDLQLAGVSEQPKWLPAREVPSLRPFGSSLLSKHLCGPMCSWLARCAPSFEAGDRGCLEVTNELEELPRSPVADVHRPHGHTPSLSTLRTKAFKASAKGRARSRPPELPGPSSGLSGAKTSGDVANERDEFITEDHERKIEL